MIVLKLNFLNFVICLVAFSYQFIIVHSQQHDYYVFELESDKQPLFHRWKVINKASNQYVDQIQDESEEVASVQQVKSQPSSAERIVVANKNQQQKVQPLAVQQQQHQQLLPPQNYQQHQVQPQQQQQQQQLVNQIPSQNYQQHSSIPITTGTSIPNQQLLPPSVIQQNIVNQPTSTQHQQYVPPNVPTKPHIQVQHEAVLNPQKICQNGGKCPQNYNYTYGQSYNYTYEYKYQGPNIVTIKDHKGNIIKQEVAAPGYTSNKYTQNNYAAEDSEVIDDTGNKIHSYYNNTFVYQPPEQTLPII